MHQDELTHTSTERFCVRSHTGFIMSETCKEGQEPFLSPVLSIHASRGTRSLPSGWHKKNSALHTPAVGSDGHQLNRGAHTPAGNHTHAHNCSITYYAPMMLVE